MTPVIKFTANERVELREVVPLPNFIIQIFGNLKYRLEKTTRKQ